MPHTGFSGAMLTRLVRADNRGFVLKRIDIARDWIMRATNDESCREAMFAAAEPRLPEGIATPALGVARDGDGYAILMHDVTPDLLPQGMVEDAVVRTILERLPSLHAATPPDGIPWCDLHLRLTLLTPQRLPVANAYNAIVAPDLAAGWPAFERHASPAARDIILGLQADTAPLLRALADLPPAFIHSDLKFDNIALAADGTMLLLDWAMPLVAPAAVEIGWFLAINSRRTTLSLDEQLRIYADAAGLSRAMRERHDALAAVCGLLLRGWRKGLDAEEGTSEELRWWCERVEAAAVLLR